MRSALSNVQIAAGALVALSIGCGPSLTLEDESGSAGGSAASSGTSQDDAGGAASANGTTAATTGAGEADTVASLPDSDEGSESVGDDAMSSAGFVGSADDGGVHPLECEIYEQDCPEGERCVPWANDGGTWNATRCSPIMREPNAVGEACEVEGDAVSGLDSCDLGLMCWDVDPASGVGTCEALCGGTEGNPTCGDPSTECTVFVEHVLPLCLQLCDPLIQDCADPSHTCIPSGGAFTCAPLPAGGGAAHGSQCDNLNDCAPGLFCVADAVAGCDGPGCCTTVCDVSVETPDAQCPGFGEGESCVQWFEEGAGFGPQYEVGVCLL